MNISLPASLKRFVDKQVAAAGYGSLSEYVRALIRRDQRREAEQALADLIGAGLESGVAREADARYWAAKRARLQSPPGKSRRKR